MFVPIISHSVIWHRAGHLKAVDEIFSFTACFLPIKNYGGKIIVFIILHTHRPLP